MRQARVNSGHEMSGRIMSDDFDGLDATEKAAIEAALNRCCALAAQIARELRNKRSEHFVDKLSLADFYASLEHAADVLGQKGRRSVENTPAPVEKRSQALEL
jgi:hypothetical protein